MFSNIEYKRSIANDIKQIYFLNIIDFNDLFDAWDGAYQSSNEKKWPLISLNNAEGAAIQSYCQTSNEAIQVLPNNKVIKTIQDSMIIYDYERFYFELVHIDDGVLAIVKYNSIIGSRWLALLDPSTVPDIALKDNLNEH